MLGSVNGKGKMMVVKVFGKVLGWPGRLDWATGEVFGEFGL